MQLGHDHVVVHIAIASPFNTGQNKVQHLTFLVGGRPNLILNKSICKI
jgi:hypothetical protein